MFTPYRQRESVNRKLLIIFFENTIITQISHKYNVQLSDDALAIKRIINNKYKHSCEKGFYHPFDNHRYNPYFNIELKEKIPFDVYFDYHVRHKLSEAAQKIASLTQVAPIDMSYDKKFDKIFTDSF